MKENLTVSLCLCIGLLSGCTNSSNVKQDLKSGGIGAAGMLLTDSEVYRKATPKELDAVTFTLLTSTLRKMDILGRYEKDSHGAFILEDTFSTGNANQFCWINNFLLAHKKDLPPNIDYSDTYLWVETKQKVFKKMLDESLGDRRMEDDCRI
ncbi:hypothetical protein F889_02539 [Acinetobacter colistiniresistens]|uniref:Lipoprotein n=1 Tax=Acinetobacter colistiniresistens TaxID=280145 RepID=N9R5I0_9GAMM|nr:hypothetical protein [Acinetobacter colistiniresistens]ENX33875.1 hypothetical protein F889_02539 [Acinetobacter colistiniresistens]